MAPTARRPHALHPSLRTILCISAHPDDNEFTIAGSVAAWTRDGRDVVFCLVTSGGAGTNEHTPRSDGLVPVRERECGEAARILGVKDVVFLRYQDGVVEPTFLLEGLANLAAGVIAMLWPGITLLAMVYLLGIWAIVSWVFLIFMSGSADRVDVFLGLDYATQIWIYRVGIWIVPVVVFFVTRRVCRELAEGQRIR